MIQQFNDLSSWRKEEITIKKNELYTLNYRDTRPNIFVVINPNKAVLKIGITNLPRTDSFEFKVDYNSTETLGRPIGTHNLYILNDSSLDINISVFSIEQDFNPEILKNLNVNLQDYTLQTTSKISGFASGVRVPVDSEVIQNQAKIISSLSNLKSVDIAALTTAVNSLVGSSAFNTFSTDIKAKVDKLLKESTFTSNETAIKTALGALLKETTFSTNASSILTKLDTIISKQGSGGSGGGGTTYDDTALINLLTAWKNAQTWSDITSVKNAVNKLVSGLHNADLTTGQKVFTLANQTTYWTVTDDNITIKKINFIRCIAGTVKVYINKQASDTTWESNMIELQKGESINDFEGTVTNIVLQGISSESKADILYQYIAS